MAGAAEANTAQDNTHSSAIARVPAPQCMVPTTGNHVAYQYVDVYNGCNKTYRVRANIGSAADSRCMGISPGQTKTDRFGPQGQFNSLYLC